MKKLILGAAVLAALATPAFAQLNIQIGPQAREYIVREGRSSVVYEGDVAVGTVLPADVEFYAIEGDPQVTTYRYAVVNDRRVIVEPSTRRIIQIVE